VVVDEEWPRMRRGEDSPRAWTALDGMFTALQGFDPGTPRASAFYDDSVRQLNAALVARRDRLDAARGGLPWVVGALILVGSVVIIGYAVLVGSRSYWFHAIGAGSIAVVVGLALVVLVDLIYPFSGDLSVDPGSFHTGILTQFFPA